ncbi:MAG TPA: CDP-alcohol phosphatidyltransferase family protein [bacterium]|nr:CDP-alcohol phosphatidyltransferase family protein [bacterium]
MTVLRSPDLFTALRMLAVPVLYTLSWRGEAAAFRLLFPLALLTDLIDGWLARRAGPSARGRYLDSIADALFYTSVPLWLWRLHPAVVRAWWPWCFPAVLLYAAGIVVKTSRCRFIAALHLPTTRVAGAAAMAYALWELWGGAPRAMMQAIWVLLALAALIELRTALGLPRAAPAARRGRP